MYPSTNLERELPASRETAQGDAQGPDISRVFMERLGGFESICNVHVENWGNELI